MPARISIPTWVGCAGVGVGTGFAYFVVSWLLILNKRYRAENHKTGSGTDTQEWLYALSDFILVFPFGWTVLNALLWVIVGRAIGAYLIWRRRLAEDRHALPRTVHPTLRS